MSDTGVDDLTAKRQASLARMEKLAFWLDDAFRIPVIGKRMGIDGILGLLPFAGDFIGMGLSSLSIAEAVRLGAPKRLIARMAANVGIDFVVGSVPLLGDIFDIYYKANRRNQHLMQRWLSDVTATPGDPSRQRRKGRPSVSIVIGVAAAVVAGLGIWRAAVGA
ncbi:DUF4112 domain-containing protein [uncultured Salinisphaera sp.]|uniref:DUF4112 domain-containing protein n=1 Tax=uncultured Salinisphaera sp. TaxID=359372 RepID=UPI0032B15089|tara:strand:- start:350 stop:841 length:492 start_codon:yes stop_codon:yes gene_type:complete